MDKQCWPVIFIFNFSYQIVYLNLKDYLPCKIERFFKLLLCFTSALLTGPYPLCLKLVLKHGALVESFQEKVTRLSKPCRPNIVESLINWCKIFCWFEWLESFSLSMDNVVFLEKKVFIISIKDSENRNTLVISW